MKKIFLFITVFLIINTSIIAGHLLGGEFTYKCLGDNQYEINLSLYRSCLCAGGTENCAYFDDTLVINIFKGNQFEYQELIVNSVDNAELVCRNDNPKVCVEKSVGYTFMFSPSSIDEDYTLTYMRCCRTPNSLNIADAAETGNTFMLTIPKKDFAKCNSSPTFKNSPPIYIKAGERFIYDHSAIDADGDSLAYELCTPFNYPEELGQPSVMIDETPPSPPYNKIKWEESITEKDPLGSESSVLVNPITGQLRIFANTIGQFVIAICVSEYRNGEFLSSTMREFQYNIFDGVCFQSICTNCVDSLLCRWCRDFNGDGLGNPRFIRKSCLPQEGFVTDCSDPNDLVNINTHNTKSIFIHPNPTKQYFKIATNSLNFNEVIYSMYNSNGQLVIPPKALKHNEILSIPSDVKSGLYYVKLNVQNKVYQEKLIVLR